MLVSQVREPSAVRPSSAVVPPSSASVVPPPSLRVRRDSVAIAVGRVLVLLFVDSLVLFGRRRILPSFFVVFFPPSSTSFPRRQIRIAAGGAGAGPAFGRGRRDHTVCAARARATSLSASRRASRRAGLRSQHALPEALTRL